MQPDGKTRVLGYSREIGQGEVVYVGLGHCHVARTNTQSTVDSSINPERIVPVDFRGVWETDTFTLLLQNAIAWGLEER